MTETLDYIKKMQDNGFDQNTINEVIKLYMEGDIDENYFFDNQKDDEIKTSNNMTITTSEKNSKISEIKYPSFLNFCDPIVLDNMKNTNFTQEDYNHMQKLFEMGKINNNILDKLKSLEIIENIKNDLDCSKISHVQKEKTAHLWDLHMNNSQVEMMSKYSVSMHITLNIYGKDIECLLDTGSMLNIISKKIVDELKLQSFVDESIQKNITGVGKNKSLGFIPYISTNMKDVHGHMFEIPFGFDVMDSKTLDKIILGLPFMMIYQVQLDFKNRCLYIGDRKVNFIIKDQLLY